MRLFHLLVLLCSVPASIAVKSSDFKTCSQAAFCRRGRALADRADAASSWTSPYSVNASTLSLAPDQASFTAAIKSALYPDIKFGLDVRIHDDGAVRVRMDEEDGLRKRYDGAASWALVSEPAISKNIKWSIGPTEARAKYGENGDVEVVVAFQPLKVTLLRDGKEQVVLNGRGLLHMEHFRNKQESDENTPVDAPVEDGQVVMQVNNRAWFEGDSEDGYWEEKFGTWTDSKPKGPESLSIDIAFPNHGHVYGIPQHATRLSLPTTRGEEAYYSDPYRLYNTDVFEYLADSPMSLYGSIPVMHAHSVDSTVAIFDAVASETWIDVAHPRPGATETHWISESGILDIFIMPGPTPVDIFTQYTKLTGTPSLPALWALGYHQCRWNYISSDDVRHVQKGFDQEDMPVDVFWLDIEYAEDHKYFIWDKRTFPDPVDMTHDVEAIGRKMVVIVDPHLKRTADYPVYEEAKELGVLVKSASGDNDYEGWCWSGSSSWIDFFNPKSWGWWKGVFKTVSQNGHWSWTESTVDTYIWNDMNEPSVFNGPEISMPRDNIHYGGWEHRDIHNINGMLLHNMTSQALMARTDPPKRPFVLTRSFYAGSQRFGAMWTGDNLGTWEHMAAGVRMVLANNIGGFSFAGSDVGGFFGNPEPEMLVRWYEVGIFSPFFRAHAHIDTKRREPYLLDEPYKSMIRGLLRLRYSMLPMWYTAFRETSVTGLPVLRPHYVVFPRDESGLAIDDQFFVGSSGLLVKPVTEKGVTETSIYLPENEVYYDYYSHDAYRGTSAGKEVVVPADLSKTPLLVHGGSIIPTRERPRRSSPLMHYDPFTLRVALSQDGAARGELYLDDGVTFSHQDGNFIWREFTADKIDSTAKSVRIVSRDLATARPDEAVDGVALAKYDESNAFTRDIVGVRVERIVVLGLAGKPTRVEVAGRKLYWEYAPGIAASDKREGVASVLVIKDPGMSIVSDWELTIQA
ncbi:glycoside hydrolase family 31 protein [Laetiporus sulphureus 93-53]|uniref:Glucosidase II subunit alpha n=1 Tax=Laetiporus sulphureus 93-53 TaxID=1314785 RepID=A0A165BKT5_9APHY|nr:glycoside hydrolase family 31 protein [Laetiporus sulphureus 93-53]KZT01236.1 glycoside hydrolase family 31 protein [Laetiporus sulphureus 93-53]